MRRELDQKSSGQVCFIDLQKAFDSLNHEILLEKLKNYGYRGPIHNILADYLSQRFQYVCQLEKKQSFERNSNWSSPGFYSGSLSFSCIYK